MNRICPICNSKLIKAEEIQLYTAFFCSAKEFIQFPDSSPKLYSHYRAWYKKDKICYSEYIMNNFYIYSQDDKSEIYSLKYRDSMISSFVATKIGEKSYSLYLEEINEKLNTYMMFS